MPTKPLALGRAAMHKVTKPIILDKSGPPVPIPTEPRRRRRLLGSKTKKRFKNFATDSFVMQKEMEDRKLSLKLHYKGIITTPGIPFE